MTKKDKTDKEKLLELLKGAGIEVDEFNNIMVMLDSGYVEVLFNYDGELIDIRSRM